MEAVDNHTFLFLIKPIKIFQGKCLLWFSWMMKENLIADIDSGIILFMALWYRQRGKYRFQEL
jgi:hypothetical protein